MPSQEHTTTSFLEAAQSDLFKVHPVTQSSEDDIAGFVNLYAKMTAATKGTAVNLSASDVQNTWSREETSRSTMRLKVTEKDTGKIVGFASCLLVAQAGSTQLAFVADPGAPIYRDLINFMRETCEKQVIPAVSVAERESNDAQGHAIFNKIVYPIRGHDPVAMLDATNSGYESMARLTGMRIDLAQIEDSELTPIFPDGFKVIPYEPEAHAKEVYELFTEEGGNEEPTMTDYPAWYNGIHGSSAFDPSLVVVLQEVHSQRLVGACYIADYSSRAPGWGYINSLVVGAKWRRQGLGLNLVKEGFRRAIAYSNCQTNAKLNFVSLEVDEQSPTNTKALYAKAGMVEDPQQNMVVLTKTLTASQDI